MSFMLSFMTACFTMAMTLFLYNDNILGESIGNFYMVTPTILAICITYLYARIMIKNKKSGNKEDVNEKTEKVQDTLDKQQIRHEDKVHS